MNKRPFNFYFFLFFVGYFLSVDLGEKRNPRESAIFFVVIQSIGLCMSIVFLTAFFGANVNFGFVILSTSGAITLINYSIFNASFVERLLPQFKYIGEVTYKRKRRIIGIICFLLFLILAIGSAAINNEEVKRYLTNVG
jgi:hypothetical protein